MGKLRRLDRSNVVTPLVQKAMERAASDPRWNARGYVLGLAHAEPRPEVRALLRQLARQLGP